MVNTTAQLTPPDMLKEINKMKRWAFDDPSEYGNIHHEYSEDEILNIFYDHWSKLMIERGKLLMITEENCIEDYITVNWAYEVI